MPPVNFFKHVILELQNDQAATNRDAAAEAAATSAASAAGSTTATASVRSLHKRFDEVSESWIYFIHRIRYTRFISVRSVRG